MRKHKMIAKGCPKCEQQVPVACKACPCGHSFFNARRNTAPGVAPGDDIRRRTQRVRREKPNYYDALVIDKQTRKARLRRSECDDDEKKDVKTKRRKVKKEEDDEDDGPSHLSAERQLQCSLILEELNRKLQLVTWKPT